ncbi:hypothetical protein FACS1894187_22910 [Synergistales bacterium]|nr:hypothetical protein FACS1894187_22910 [Synergistales bacterium]
MNGYVGFSWTVLFFGPFVPLLRGDYKWAVIMLVFDIFTGHLASLVLAFMYNKIYTRSLIIDKGFVPADDRSRQQLRIAGIA